MTVHTETGRRFLHVCGWIGAFFLFACGLPAAEATADPLADIRHLPASNPYRKTLEQWLSLPPEERATLSSWAGKKGEGQTPVTTLTAEQSERVASLTASLLAASRQPNTAVWPLVPSAAEPDNPMAGTLPHVRVVMDLGRLVAKGTESLPPHDAIQTAAAIAQMGRQMRAKEGAIMDHFLGGALESLATTSMAKRLGEFSTADLDEMHTAWAALKAALGSDQALRGERDLFFRPFLKQILKPGLAALLAEQEGLEETAPATEGSVGAGLRLTAIINDGQRMIGLEDKAKGRSFFVAEGKTVNEVTLVSIDFKQNRAALRIGDKDAIMDLTSKRIVARQPAANRLIRMLDMGGAFSQDPEKSADELISNLVQRIRNRPGGLDGFIQQLESDYDKVLAESLLWAEQPKTITRSNGFPFEDPLLNALIPNTDIVPRRINQADLTVAMLDAAASLRRQELAGQPLQAPPDPWAKDGESLHVERKPDGSFILRSIYESSKGKPVEYKFAAPDAGLIRR